MRINTERVRIENGRIIVSHLEPDPSLPEGFREVAGGLERDRHPFNAPQRVPAESMPVDPQIQRIFVPSTGDTKFLVLPQPDPKALKFLSVNGRVFIEHGNFSVRNDELVWFGPLTLKPNDRIYFFCFGREYTDLFMRLDTIEAASDRQTEFTLSGISRRGVGEVILDGRTYFAGQSFKVVGDRLHWMDPSRPIKKGDRLNVLFFLQHNSASMFRYQRSFRLATSNPTSLTLDVVPSDPAGVRVYVDGYLYLPNVPGQVGFFNVNGRTLTWADFSVQLPAGRRVNIVIPTAARITQDPAISAVGSETALNDSRPVITQDGQVVIPVSNPPQVRTKSLLLVGGLAYAQKQGYDLDDAGNILWGGSPSLKTKDHMRLIGFNDQGVADGTVIERIPVLGGVPGPLTYEPSDPTKVVAIVSSSNSYGGLALFAGGYFDVRGKQIDWMGEYPPVPLKDTDNLVVVYFRDLTVASEMIYDRKILSAEEVARRSYDLGVSPLEPQRSIWAINGEIMRWGIDYVISGSTLWYIGTRVALRAGDEAGLVTR